MVVTHFRHLHNPPRPRPDASSSRNCVRDAARRARALERKRGIVETRAADSCRCSLYRLYECFSGLDASITVPVLLFKLASSLIETDVACPEARHEEAVAVEVRRDGRRIT